MMTREKLIEKLEKDIEKTELKISKNEHPSIKNHIISTLLKGGIALKYCLPYLLSSIMVFYFANELTNKTIFIDKVKDKAYVEYMITSTDIERETISYDINYSKEDLYNNCVIYNTGWKLTDDNEYARKEIIYDYELEDNMFNKDKIVNLTKDTLDEYLEVRETKDIKKDYLTNEDRFYMDEMVIFRKYEISDDIFRIRNETLPENISDLAALFVAIYLVGQLMNMTLDYTSRRYLDRKLNELEIKYKVLSKNELIELRNILALKKQNLDLITNNIKVKKLGDKYAK